MSKYRITVHLSSDFGRTTDLAYGFKSEGEPDSLERAASEGVYDGEGFSFTVYDADSALDAAEVAWAVTNSYPEVMHCHGLYADAVHDYRGAGHRSLSMGDLVVVRHADGPRASDGRYVAVRTGFRFLDEPEAAS